MVDLEIRVPTHCDCCLKKGELEGPFNVGPYTHVCKRCRKQSSLWYPGQSHDYQRRPCEYGNYVISPDETLLNVLLVEPDYYSRFPPLGLLKLASYHLGRGDNVRLIKMSRNIQVDFLPSVIYVTSLFTWAWKSVWEAIGRLRILYGNTKIILGGIYASILPDHAAMSGADFVHVGLMPQIEDEIPAYQLLPKWKGSILFATRGCIRRCSFCIVPKLEGGIQAPKSDILPYIHPSHDRVYLFDNNILASDNFIRVAEQLAGTKYKVDFNQGLDARLITPEIAQILSRIRQPMLHLAYDNKASRLAVKRAIELLKEVGFRGKDMVFYTLHNRKDTPEDFLLRLKDLMEWGVVCYPMRFEPLNTLHKGQYISEGWTAAELEMIAEGRRVLGKFGAFVAYEELADKILAAETLQEAMELRPMYYQSDTLNLEEYF